MADERRSTPTSKVAAESRWDRWDLLWEGFFALTLALPTVVAVVRAPAVEHAVVTLGLAAGLTLWHWRLAMRHPERDGSVWSVVWFAGVLAFTAVLLGRHESYLGLIYGLFPQIFGRLGRWAVPGVVALSVVVAWRAGMVTGAAPSEWVVNVGSMILLSLLVGLFVTALVRQNAARKEALQALEATRGELADTARRAGMLEERERVVRDLHDTIAQGFTGIVMQLEACEQALEGDPAVAREHLGRAKESARGSLAEVRRAVHAMHPRALEGASLNEALDRTVRRWSEETGIPATFLASGSPARLRPDAEVALLRTAQESLANVAQHAAASKASVRLEYAPEQVVLTIEDDGAGFRPAETGTNGGLGLEGMTERLDALGGHLRVDSTPGRGSRLDAEVPTP